MNNHVNIDDIIQRLLSARNNSDQFVDLEEKEMIALCMLTTNVLMSQPTVLELNVPVNICGDIHGQFIDLLRLFELGGSPDEKNYLFLGDYVDRGERSTETISLLYAYKVKYPERFFLLRGNHEDASINRVYGFYKECDFRYSVKVWKAFVQSFKYLPLAAIIRNKIFCCHGGLSPELILNQIRKIPRPIEKINKGVICDLLWSDPARNIQGWADSPRGISVIFGEDKVEEFLSENNFDLMCRGHQVVEDGYEFFANRKLVTIFSAPNYCGRFDNAGAIMCVDSSLTCSFKILKSKIKESALWALP